MRIHLLSDIHLEFGMLPEHYDPPECDVVVLAGDIWLGVHGVTWANETFDKPVIYVNGNHEFYRRQKIEPTIARQREVAASHVHVLENDQIILDGVRFIGGTMWTDFNLYGTPELSMAIAREGMSDFHVIQREPYGKLRPSDVRAKHYETLSFFDQRMKEKHDGPTVAVTHHGPSEQSLSAMYREHRHGLNPAFASNLENFILTHQPDLWLHGHVHEAMDYQIDKTRVVCNPRGYESRGEVVHGFDLHKVIEVGVA